MHKHEHEGNGCLWLKADSLHVLPCTMYNHHFGGFEAVKAPQTDSSSVKERHAGNSGCDRQVDHI